MASNYFVQQPLMMLSERAVRTIHESALALLRRVGIRVASEEALELLSDYGVRCDRAAMRAYPDEDSVPKALGTAQKQYTLYGRYAHAGRTLTMDARHSHLCSGAAAMRIYDGGTCRECTRQDLIEMTVLHERLDPIDILMNVVEPKEMAGPWMYPLIGHPHTAANSRDRSYRPDVFAVGSLTRTLAAGEKTVYQKARERAESLLGERGLLAPQTLREELLRLAVSGHQP